MFRGHSPTRIDDKGRLKVPADFKRELDERYGATKFYITSVDGKIAQIYPMEEWERMEQKLAQLPTLHPTRKKFLDRTNYYGQVVEMDGQGRLLIPSILRESANIAGDVLVFGNLTNLEVHNAEEFKKAMHDNPFTPEDAETLGKLGI